MDGITALRYARSRKTTSDFDRSERQSIVIQSILEEIKSQSLFDSVPKINSYLNIVGDNLKTNMQFDEIYSLAKIMEDVDISNNYLRLVWSAGNGILCESQPVYSISYCGGAVIGSDQISDGKIRAKDQVSNLLLSAELDSLFSEEVVMLSNGSTDVYNLRNELYSLGFTDIKFNNSYRVVPPIQRNTSSTKTLYILDDNLRDLYNRLGEKKPEMLSEPFDTIPNDRVIPDAYEDSKIIIWTE